MHKQDTGAPKPWRRLALGVALLWLAGCYGPSALQMDYGQSVRNDIAQQVLNPRAGLNQRPAVGLPPQAAANEMANYDKSFSYEDQQLRAQQMKMQTTNK